MVKVNLITRDKSLTQHCPEVMQGGRARGKGLGRALGGTGGCCWDPQERGCASPFAPPSLFCRVLSIPIPLSENS